MTGVFEDGSYRLIANARSQWESVTNGYRTVAGSVDGKILNLDGESYLGAGLQVTSDQAGDLNFTKNSASLNVSGVRSLDQRNANFITFGMQASLQSYRIDYNNLIGFDVEPLIQQGAPNRIQFFDFSAGASWYYSFQKRGTFYLGAAMFHINRPNTSFLQRNDFDDPALTAQYDSEELHRKYVVHGGGYWRASKRFALLPSVVFLDQGPHRQINTGSFLQIIDGNSYKKPDKSFFVGLWARWYAVAQTNDSGWDALVAALRFDHQRTSYTLSLDFNVSPLKRASAGRGGPEISIIHILGDDSAGSKLNRIRCPMM